jgi:hypothetical protein
MSSGQERGHGAEGVIRGERTDSQDDEVVGVLRWRTSQLVQAGFPPPRATELAVRLDVNLHEAVALTANGCPPETAARILL